MYFFIDDNTDPTFNLALEETLGSKFPEPFLMLWRNRSSVIVGKNQNTFAEVNAAFVKEHDIPVVRRMTGGGAVYHDLGNVNYSLVFHERHTGADSFALFARPVVDALRNMGVDAEFSGRNDILVEGRKISGSAQCALKERTLFHGTLLFDADMTMLTQVLTPRPVKLESKGVKSVRARVANLKEFLPQMSVESFMAHLARQLVSFAGEIRPIAPEWLEQAGTLADERYRNWSWNWGAPFEAPWENSKRFEGAGILELKVKLLNGVVSECKLTGDFFGDPGVVENALKGVLFRKDAIAEALKTLSVSDHIRGVDNAMFLSLIEL